MNVFEKENGITLVSLMVTIVVLLIIASISINIGSDSLEETRLKGFYTNLEIIQKRVDQIAETNESYINTNNELVYIKQQGISYEDLPESNKTKLQDIINQEGLIVDITKFRYFTAEDLSNIMDINDIEYNVFIDFDNRIIIAEDGIEIGDNIYYTFEDTKYLVQYNASSLPTITDINYSINEYGDNKYKLKIIPTYSDNETRKGTIKYKKSTSNYWKNSNNLEIIIEELDTYDIIYKDSYNNTKEESILIESNNNILTVTKLSNTQE